MEKITRQESTKNEQHKIFYYYRFILKKESVIKPETQLLRGLRNRRFLDRVGFLTTLGVGFIYLTPELQLNHFLHRPLPNSCLLKNGTISFETFMETENSCCVPRFPLIASCYRIVDSQTSFTFLQSRESEILERSVSGILPPTPQPWLLPRISYYFKRLNWTKSLQEVSFFFDNIVLNLCQKFQMEVIINIKLTIFNSPKDKIQRNKHNIGNLVSINLLF